MHITKSIFYILFLVAYVQSSQAESCLDVSFDHLDLSSSKIGTEAAFCLDCVIQDSSSNVYQQALTTSRWVPAESCFTASIQHRKSGKQRVCHRGNLKNLRKWTGSICKTPKYIKATAQVFQEVTQCLDIQDPSYFYALINRESRFQITAESHTGASCYGQLTGVAIQEINDKLIPFTAATKEKCDGIVNNWEPLNTTKSGKKTSATICKASSNPYSCLTYSALYYRDLLKQATKEVAQLGLVRVSFKNQNKGKYNLFINTNSFKKYINKYPHLQIDDRQTHSIFQNKKEIAQMIALQAYNGGPSVINLLKTYTNQIKGSIFSKDKEISKKYKTQILKTPVGISSSDFVKTFKQYTSKNSRANHKTENANFVSNVLNDYVSVTGNLSACGALPAKQLLRPQNRFRVSY